VNRVHLQGKMERKIGKKEVEHVAMLARLRLSPEEIEVYTEQLNAILEYMDKLNELDTHGIETTSYVIFADTPMRDDIVGESIHKEQGLANAPDRESDFFKVPKIVE